MGLQKGHTNNPNGRPKGSKNKVTQDLRERITAFIGDELERVIKDYKRLPLPERMRFFERLLGYALPKLQSVEYSLPAPQSYVENTARPMTDKELQMINDYCAQWTEPNSNSTDNLSD